MYIFVKKYMRNTYIRNSYDSDDNDEAKYT